MTIARLRQFFEAHPGIEAAVAVDTVIAMLAYGVLMEMGLTVPDKVKLVSFDDPKLPFVPFVQQDTETIARRAVDILIEQMEKGYRVERVTVPVRFVDRVRYPMPDDIPHGDDLM